MTMDAERERLEDPTVHFEDGESGQELRYTGGIWKVGNVRKQSPLQCLGGGATLPIPSF